MAYQLLANIILDVPNIFFTSILKKSPSDYQWIMGFGLPIIREISSWLKRKCLSHAFDETRTNLIVMIVTNIQYAAHTSIALGTFATQSTGYVILSFDFLMNVWSAFKISRIHNKVIPEQASNKKLMKDLQSKVSELALVEIIEFVVPMNYFISLVIAMYGPNSLILGNYGNGYWQFKAIESLDKYLLAAFEMFFVDCCSFPVGSFILWRFCSINFMREVCQQIKKHGCFIALVMAYVLVSVSVLKNMIYLGIKFQIYISKF